METAAYRSLVVTSIKAVAENMEQFVCRLEDEAEKGGCFDQRVKPENHKWPYVHRQSGFRRSKHQAHGC